MKYIFLLAFITAVFTAVGVHAEHAAAAKRMTRRHVAVAHANGEKQLLARKSNGRCKARPKTSSAPAAAFAAPTTQKEEPKPTTKDEPKPTTKDEPKPTTKDEPKPKPTSTQKDEPKPTQKPPTKNEGAVNTNSALISVTSNQCGGNRATKDVTAVSGPNGHIDWLNCGLMDGGWNPPHVTLDNVKAVDLSWAVSQANSPFKACGQFIDLFNKYGGAHGIPPIILASIAMQESSCNPATVGGAGEQGLMQLTKDKCPSNGDCKEPNYNINRGAQFLRETIDGSGGNLLLAVGRYNGWHQDLTFGGATAIAKVCCRCQNNVDYLQQFFNGWLQNVNAYSTNPRLGKYFNLDACPSG